MAAQRRYESKTVNLKGWFAGQVGVHAGHAPGAEGFQNHGFWRRSLGTFCRCWQKVTRGRQNKGAMQGYCGCPCCGGQNFRAVLRRTPPILTAATGSGPPSCQPIPGHCRGRQSGHFLEIASLILPQAALRRFPCFIRHQRRSDRSPRARRALAMTSFLQEVPPKTVRARSVDSRVKPCG